MGALTRDKLREKAQKQNLPRERVDTPELEPDSYVWVVGLTGKERDEFEKSNYTVRRGRVSPNLDNVRARLAAKCLVDDSGERLCSEADAEWLGSLRGDTLSRIYAVAQRLSNVTDEDIDELKKFSESAAAGTATS